MNDSSFPRNITSSGSDPELVGESEARYRWRPEWLAATSLCLFIFALAYLSPVTFAAADPHFSLITAQSIVDHGTIRLDAYQETDAPLFDQFYYQLAKYNDHTYYNYPLGPSIVTLPAVWLSRQLGKDMLLIGDNHWLQNLLSAAIVPFVFVVLYLMGRAYLPPRSSLIITTVTVLGSSLLSTMATALWNLDFTVLFLSLAFLLVARFDSDRTLDSHPVLIGLFLFAAYLCRPSAAIYILVILLYLLAKDRRALFVAASTSLMLLVVFVLFSKREYGQWLPFYYTASSWFNTADIWKPLYGLLLSPARGLFIFSPFLILVPFGAVWLIRHKSGALLFWLCAFGFGLHILSVATTRQWWGGYSFGPRLLTDAMPALALMTILLWRDARERLGMTSRWVIIASYFSLAMIAVLINTVQGLFNIHATLWNAFPSIDAYPQYIFDWRYPQFLTTSASFHNRRLGHYLGEDSLGQLQISSLPLGEELTLADDMDRALFIGWWNAGPQGNWTEIETPSILFLLNQIDEEGTYELALSAESLDTQKVTVLINGLEIGTVTFQGSRQTNTMLLPGEALQSDELNWIQLRIPQASRPSLAQLRRLGLESLPHRLGLKDVRLRLTLTGKTDAWHRSAIPVQLSHG